MRLPQLLTLTSVAVLLLALTPAQAQIKGARDYTKRIQPQAPPPPPRPAAPPRPAPAVRPAAPAQPAVPPPPRTQADVEREQAAKRDALRKTVEFQKKRAEEGSATSQYDLGLRYLSGDGVPRDPALARKWLESSSKAGNAAAKVKLTQLDADAPSP